VPESVKDDLDEHREERPWGSYLEQLRREHADPLTFNEAQEIADVVAESIETENLDIDEIVDRLKNELSMANEPGVEVDTAELIEEIDRLKEMVERVPERAADQFERKYR
jgi:hypothetical protein